MVEFGKVNFFLSKKPKNKREEIIKKNKKKIIKNILIKKDVFKILKIKRAKVAV